MGIKLHSEPMSGLQIDTINIDINNTGFKPKPHPYLHFGSAA